MASGAPNARSVQAATAAAVVRHPDLDAHGVARRRTAGRGADHDPSGPAEAMARP